ncbi:MAG: GNAT family N-acetyltransferase [Roseobacter sp.]
MITIPTITTDRLVLRAPCEADVEPFAAFYASDAARFVGGPQRDFEVWRYVAEVIGHWSLRGFGRWMVERKETPGAIGLVGLHAPLDWPEPEVGWMLWGGNGKGYASEAGRAARDYGYQTLGMTTLISQISPGNDDSVRVAESMGAVREAADNEHPVYGTLQVYRHPAPEVLQ